MIRINKRYLKNIEIRNDIGTRNEVLAIQFVNDYISPNNIWNVGADTNLNLPDIYSDKRDIGFEVVRCEAKIDFTHNDITKEFIKINYDYNKYQEIKSYDENHIFNKLNLKLTVIDNKIAASSTTEYGHSLDWMLEDYKNTIDKKLKKLNNGNYSLCENVSLIILNLDRANSLFSAEQVQKAYLEVKNKYAMTFDNIYYITTDGIYVINDIGLYTLKIFDDIEYSQCVKKMKMTLIIDEYEE